MSGIVFLIVFIFIEFSRTWTIYYKAKICATEVSNMCLKMSKTNVDRNYAFDDDFIIGGWSAYDWDLNPLIMDSGIDDSGKIFDIEEDSNGDMRICQSINGEWDGSTATHVLKKLCVAIFHRDLKTPPEICNPSCNSDSVTGTYFFAMARYDHDVYKNHQIKWRKNDQCVSMAGNRRVYGFYGLWDGYGGNKLIRGVQNANKHLEMGNDVTNIINSCWEINKICKCNIQGGKCISFYEGYEIKTCFYGYENSKYDCLNFLQSFYKDSQYDQRWLNEYDIMNALKIGDPAHGQTKELSVLLKYGNYEREDNLKFHGSWVRFPPTPSRYDEICHCNAPYNGDTCYGYQCFNKQYYNPQVCNSHGDCVIMKDSTYCNCYGPYEGQECKNYKCNGYNYNDENVCSKHGSCNVNGGVTSCSCDSPYEGSNCENYKCSGINSNSETVCNGNGNCIVENVAAVCSCNSPYEGSTCEYFKCGNYKSTNEIVCNGNGDCKNINGISSCSCNPPYSGDYCDIFKCNNIAYNDVNVCSNHGKCLMNHGITQCNCFSPYFGDSCDNYKCNDVLYNDPSVCNGAAKCIVDNGIAKCSSCKGSYYGDNCDTFKCGDLDSTDGNVCNGRGKCIINTTNAISSCKCISPFYGDYCENYKCNNILYNDPKVCSGIGKCDIIKGTSQCICKPGYEGKNCEFIQCNGIGSQNPSVCNAHGICIIENEVSKCACNVDYKGINCEEKYDCSDFGETCENGGKCSISNVLPDGTYKVNCLCNFKYFEGFKCEFPKCGDKYMDDKDVCNANGKCVMTKDNKLPHCECEKGDILNYCAIDLSGLQGTKPDGSGSNGIVTAMIILPLLFICICCVIPIIIVITIVFVLKYGNFLKVNEKKRGKVEQEEPFIQK